jgi:transposase
VVLILLRQLVFLLSGGGVGTSAICREARVSKPTVWRRQKAYMEGGIERLKKDRGKGPRAGKPRISDEGRLAIVRRRAQEKPANAMHWSARTLPAELGIGHTTVQRVWKEHGLKPPRIAFSVGSWHRAEDLGTEASPAAMEGYS